MFKKLQVVRNVRPLVDEAGREIPEGSRLIVVRATPDCVVASPSSGVRSAIVNGRLVVAANDAFMSVRRGRPKKIVQTP